MREDKSKKISILISLIVFLIFITGCIEESPIEKVIKATTNPQQRLILVKTKKKTAFCFFVSLLDLFDNIFPY